MAIQRVFLGLCITLFLMYPGTLSAAPRELPLGGDDWKIVAFEPGKSVERKICNEVDPTRPFHDPDPETNRGDTVEVVLPTEAEAVWRAGNPSGTWNSVM